MNIILDKYEQDGYLVVKQVVSASQLDSVHPVLERFHQLWMEKNRDFYQKRAINSAYLTSDTYLNADDRRSLFEFIALPELIQVVEQVIPQPAFMNTQLFFDPYDPDKTNYWHRDIQYSNSEDQQKNMLAGGSSMPHFRIPMVDEKGLELIPGSHKRWDTNEELDVRQEKNGRHCHDDLPDGKIIELQRGDLLIFSAKMLHRGIYGGDRFAFDLLYAEPDSDYLQTVPEKCLPDTDMLAALPDSEIYKRTFNALKADNS